MSDRLLVVLDREAAEGSQLSLLKPEWNPAARGRGDAAVQKAVAAALDRDREELVERVGMALSARRGSEVVWDEDRDAARAVLAALGEGEVWAWAEDSDEGAGDREGRILDGETGGRPLAASPVVPPVGNATPDRQGGEGPVDEEGPGLSPELLPAGLIDRAVGAIEWTCNCDGNDLDLHLAVRRCAPLLVEHGRQQERERVLRSRLVKSGDEVPAPARWLDGELNKAEARGAAAEKARWEARIEKLATWEDRARAEQGKVARWLEESGSKMAREVREDEYRHAYTGRVLRSLRTGEGDGE